MSEQQIAFVLRQAEEATTPRRAGDLIFYRPLTTQASRTALMCIQIAVIHPPPDSGVFGYPPMAQGRKAAVTRMALKQWVVRLAVCFAVAVVSSCSTWIWAPPLFRPTPPPAALTTGLSGKWSVVSGEFDRRVKAAFPCRNSHWTNGRRLTATRIHAPGLGLIK